MNKLGLFIFIAAVLFYSGSRVKSQEKWSLEQCIQYAMENNLAIKQQKLSVELSENAYTQSRASRIPSLNAGASPNLNYGRSIDPVTNLPVTDNVQSFNYSVRSSVTLFNGFQIRNSIEQNRLDLMASHKDVEKIQNDVSLNIASAYLQILFNYELLEIAKNQLEITQQQVERTRALVEAGSVPKGSLLEIEAQAASENLRVVNAENQLQMSYLNLTQLLELDHSEGFAIEIPDFSDVAIHQLYYSIDEVYREALEIQPHIESARLDLEIANRGLNIARGRRSPSLSLSSSYSSHYRRLVRDGDVFGDPDPFVDQIKDNQSFAFSLSLSIPIFNSLQTHTSIQNAKVGILNSEYSLQQTKNRLFNDIQQAYTDASASYEKYLATEKAVQSMSEAFRYTEERFEVGMVNVVDYNLAKNQLTSAQSDLLTAKYEYIFTTNVLEFYLGNPISF